MRIIDANIVRQQITNLMAACPEAWDEGDDVLLTDMLHAETDLQEFLTIVEDRRQDSASMAGGIASRVAELELRQKRFEQREKSMRELAFKIMQAAEVKKVELPIATLSVVNGRPKVIITNEDALPGDCLKIKYEPDKTKIKAYLDTGEAIPGAYLSNAEPHLSVRTK